MSEVYIVGTRPLNESADMTSSKLQVFRALYRTNSKLLVTA